MKLKPSLTTPKALKARRMKDIRISGEKIDSSLYSPEF